MIEMMKKLLGMSVKTAEDSETFITTDTHYHPLTETQDRVRINCAARNAWFTQNLVEKSDRHFYMTNVLFSGSGQGKYVIVKNGIVLATLFGQSANGYIAPYPFKILVNKGDTISVEFTNIDMRPQDLYLGFDVQEIIGSN